jgi:hypothetical protein
MAAWFMTRKPSSNAAPEGEAGTPKDLDFAWRVHTAIQDWTKNVDNKASITLAIVTAVGGFAASQVFGQNGSLHAVHGDQLWPIRTMGVAFLVAGLSALYAVFPSLKRRRSKELAGTGLIFFGHLRHRSTEEIEAALLDLDNAAIRHQLASQLRVTSDIAWRKHARLQLAHIALFVAVTAFAVSELWS